MGTSNTTLVIDENSVRSNKLIASLCFIGENAVEATAQVIQESALHHVDVIFLGAIVGADYEALIKRQPETPFILIGETLKSLLSLPNVIGILSGRD